MTSNTFITFNVYSCCNWCLSQLNAERMILINTVVMHMEQQHVLVKIVLFL